MAASNYDGWCSDVLSLPLEARGRLLDVGCGTGNSFLPFLGRGWEVTGCDSSLRMLEVADYKRPGADLKDLDARRLPTLGKFDLITLTSDVVNHFIFPRELIGAFSGAARNLAPGGALVFDVNSIRCYRGFFSERHLVASGDFEFRWRGLAQPDVREGSLVGGSIDVGEGASWHNLATVWERHHPDHELRRYLRACGFDRIDVYERAPNGGLVAPAPEVGGEKLVYLARMSKAAVRKGVGNALDLFPDSSSVTSGRSRSSRCD